MESQSTGGGVPDAPLGVTPVRFFSYSSEVDALRQSDLEIARTTPPGVKLRQALEMMRLGLELERRKLRASHPQESEARIDELLLAWMAAPR